MYITAKDGTSNPVIHISTTIAILKFELLFLNCLSSFFRYSFVPQASNRSFSSFCPCVATKFTLGSAISLSNSSFESWLSSSAFFASPHSGRIETISLRTLNASALSAQTIIAFCTISGFSAHKDS